MGSINTSRWLLSGIVAGVVLWLLEGAASLLYMDSMTLALEAHGLAMAMTAEAVMLSVVVSLIAGLTLMFFYAACRPRFGPGPRNAVIVAFGLWVGGYLTSLLGYRMLGLFPDSLLLMWGVVGLVEMIVAALVGGWIYKEEATPVG
ncbi:MAG TPA: hypothetical protein VMR66_01765 [Gemmatimonadota bacterium]|nr:hypothetical protein [Gemmatimonadota bacterium]